MTQSDTTETEEAERALPLNLTPGELSVASLLIQRGEPPGAAHEDDEFASDYRSLVSKLEYSERSVWPSTECDILERVETHLEYLLQEAHGRMVWPDEEVQQLEQDLEKFREFKQTIAPEQSER